MEAPTYEYRNGSLWIRLDTGDQPGVLHADLFRALTEFLEAIECDSGRPQPGSFFMLLRLLAALKPTPAHLHNGWQAEADERADEARFADNPNGEE